MHCELRKSSTVHRSHDILPADNIHADNLTGFGMLISKNEHSNFRQLRTRIKFK